MSQGSILSDALSSAFLKKKGKKERERNEMARGLFPEQTCPIGCATEISLTVRCN
jgi:hypothetical protein